MNLTAPKQILNFIDGQFSDPEKGRFMDNVNLATGKVYSRTPDSDEEEVQMAAFIKTRLLPAL